MKSSVQLPNKLSVYIPDKLKDKVEQYLEHHPDISVSGLIQEALEEKVAPRRNRLLDLAGFVSYTPGDRRSAEERAEDERERPEDEPIKRGWDRR
jgi:metal-responsive CopG/Arc/MetJ family transcriptional regulator